MRQQGMDPALRSANVDVALVGAVSACVAETAAFRTLMDPQHSHHHQRLVSHRSMHLPPQIAPHSQHLHDYFELLVLGQTVASSASGYSAVVWASQTPTDHLHCNRLQWNRANSPPMDLHLQHLPLEQLQSMALSQGLAVLPALHLCASPHVLRLALATWWHSRALYTALPNLSNCLQNHRVAASTKVLVLLPTMSLHPPR
mmetsp:Transcript_104792/g.192073  ORF Transcript_104792/g.192073 Transcript_104792/m.192073 type:complete len:201 (-) Transcript_104792:1472-2074(-)